MRNKVLISLFLVICAAGSLFSQNVSEKKEIAVFALAYSGWDIPSGVLGAVDDAVKEVFVNLGRFEVIGMTYRLEEGEVTAFIDKIKSVKEENLEIPEGVRLGEETFTESDFNRLTGSFIVVIPTVSFYRVDYDDDDDVYEAEVQASFTFINVEEYKTIAQFSVDAIGSGDSSMEAAKDAVDFIPVQLAYEIKNVDEFQLKTGLLEIKGRRVLLELGKNMGIKVGDEFSLVNPRVLPTGHIVSEEIGLIEVTEVLDSVSYGRIVYSNPKPVVGDQLEEIPRFGFETEAYIHAAQTNLGIVLLPGIRVTATRGLRRLRPVVGFEIPINQNREIIDFGLPFSAYIGAELNWAFARFQLLPSIHFGFSGIIPVWEMDDDDPDWVLSHVGGSAQLGLSYLVTRDVRLQLDGGAVFYSSVFINSNSYYGPYGGLSIKMKL